MFFCTFFNIYLYIEEKNKKKDIKKNIKICFFLTLL